MVVLGLNATLTAEVMAVGDAHVFSGFLTSTNTAFLSKATNYFSQCFYRGERQTYAGKEVRLSRGSNSQPPGHESDTFTTEPPERGKIIFGKAKVCSLYT